MRSVIRHLRNWFDANASVSCPDLVNSLEPDLTKPQLPFELIELILHHLWHSSLSRQDRIHLLTSSLLVSRSFMKALILVSSQSIYLPSSSYMSYLFLTVLRGRSRIYSPNFADLGLTPSFIQNRCRTLTLHIEPHKSLFLRRAEAYCRTGDIALFYQSDPGLLFPHLYHLCHTYGITNSFLPNATKLVLEFRNQIPSRYDAVRIFAALAGAKGASGLNELEMRYGWDEDTPKCILDTFSSKGQWSDVREELPLQQHHSKSEKDGRSPEETAMELRGRMDHTEAIRRSGLPLSTLVNPNNREEEQGCADNTDSNLTVSRAPTLPTTSTKPRSKSESTSKPASNDGPLMRSQSRRRARGKKEWGLDPFGISCCEELSAICDSSVLLSQFPATYPSSSNVSSIHTPPSPSPSAYIFNPLAPQIKTLSVYGVCEEMVMNLVSRCPNLLYFKSDVELEQEWITEYLGRSGVEIESGSVDSIVEKAADKNDSRSEVDQEPVVEWDLTALVGIWGNEEKERDIQRKRLKCALHPSCTDVPSRTALDDRIDC